jgi:hypothetical protein
MASTYLTRTTGSPTNSKKFTVSGWFKIFDTTENQFLQHYTDGSNREHMYFASGTFRWYCNDGGTTRVFVKPNMQFTDMAAFYHIVIACDTTQNTVSDRVKIYVNGSQITSFDTATYPPQNFDFLINSNNKLLAMGRYMGIDDYYYDGIISHFHFIDGTQYDATAFGETDTTTGEWKIKSAPSVTYGNNGYFILRDGNSVTDQSGNSNNFTVAGGTLTKTEDCPDNVFATLNPLAQTLSGITYSNGNTVASMTGDVGQRQSISTLGMPSGKFYMECKLQAIGSTGGSFPYVGIVAQEKYDADMYVGGNGTGWHPTGDIYNGGSNSSSGSTYTTGDIIGVAVDIDNSKLYWHKNGTYILSGNPSTGANGYDISARTAEGVLGFGVSHWNNNGIWQTNFGNGYFGTTAVSSAGTNASENGIFEYDVPAGFTALSTKGLNL